MKDDEFTRLKLEVSIAPTQVRWPAPEAFTHWARLHKAADTARAAVQAAWLEQDKIEKNPDLTLPAKRKHRASAAAEAIAALAEDRAIVSARESAGNMLKRWRIEAEGIIKQQPDDAREIALHQEIRLRVAAIATKDRLPWLAKHASDPLVFSALLTAPAYLSGLDDAELGLVKAAAEAAIDASLDPKVREARDQTTKALADVERGWRTAVKLIAEKGGLERDAAGGWEIPKVAA